MIRTLESLIIYVISKLINCIALSRVFKILTGDTFRNRGINDKIVSESTINDISSTLILCSYSDSMMISDNNNNTYLIDSERSKCIKKNSVSNDVDYIDSSRSNSVDSGRGNDSSNPSQSISGKTSLSSGGCDSKTSVSSSRSTPVDPGYQHNSSYLYAMKRTSVDVIDSGISSPMSMVSDQLDSIKKKRRASSKTETEYDRLELLSGDQFQSDIQCSKQQLRIQKLSTCHQNPGGIGSIVSRIRSLSIGVSPSSSSSSRQPSGEGFSLPSDSMSPTCLSPDRDPDPMKLPKEHANSSLNFTSKNIRNNKKWIRMTHSLSCDVESFNYNDLPSRNSKNRYRSSEETVYVSSASPAMNRLERFLSGHIDTSTPNGALISVINQGLRKVSESDRYLLFSKSPLRSPIDFLDAGIEHLGDSDILITVLHHSTCYDLMPESGKLIIIDSALPISKAFVAIEDNNVDSAPIWNSQDESFIGLLSKTNQMYLLLMAYQYRDRCVDVDTYMDRISRESLLNCIGRDPTRHLLQRINPETTICSVIKRLDLTSSVQVLVIDEQRSGNALYILDHRRILSFLLSASQYGLPLPSVLKTTIGVTELMMARRTLERYKVHLTTDLVTVLKVMDGNPHHCAIVCTEKTACKSCLCTEECVGLLTVDDISLLIAQSNHCDPTLIVEAILNQTTKSQKNIAYCDEREPVINIIKSIVQEKVPFILINQDCCRNCIHSIVSSKELLNYIMKHDKCSAVRETTFVPEKRRSMRSYSCCEETHKLSDMNLSGVSFDEKDEDVFNMDVS